MKDAMPPVRSMAPLTLRRVAAFYVPLAAGGLLLSLSGPAINAALARTPDAEAALASYAVAFSITTAAHGLIWSLRQVAIALGRDRASRRLIRRFTFAIGASVSGLIVLLCLTPLYGLLVVGAMGVPPALAGASRPALLIMGALPLIAAWRIYYQGILTRYRHPTAVGVGCLSQFLCIAGTLWVALIYTDLRGVCLSAWAVVAGESANFLTVWIWNRAVGAERQNPEGGERLTLRPIVAFYAPLAGATMLMSLSDPLITAGIAHTPLAAVGLAAYPVCVSVMWLLDSPLWNIQQVTLALSHDAHSYGVIRRFAALMSLGATGLFALFAFTPLADVFLGRVIGVHGEVKALAAHGLMLMAPLPFWMSWRSLFQGALIGQRRTGLVNRAVIVRQGLMAALILGGIWYGRLSGLYIAIGAIALVNGVETALLRRSMRRIGFPVGSRQ